MALDDLRVKDLNNIMHLIHATTEAIGVNALGLLDDPAATEAQMKANMQNFHDSLEDGFWDVPRLSALIALRTAADSVLDGLKATQEVR